jgi:hypothetical protein
VPVGDTKNTPIKVDEGTSIQNPTLPTLSSPLTPDTSLLPISATSSPKSSGAPAPIAINMGATGSGGSGSVIGGSLLPPGSLSTPLNVGANFNTIYEEVITMVNNTAPDIFKNLQLTGTQSIGLFEFVDPNFFFLSIDDGKNPKGMTAFRTKALFQYAPDLTLTRIGHFEYDEMARAYLTIEGSNPHAKSLRARRANPAYRGRLLSEEEMGDGSGVASTSGVSGVPAASTPSSKPKIGTPSASTTKTSGLSLVQIRSLYTNARKNPKLYPEVIQATSDLIQRE